MDEGKKELNTSPNRPIDDADNTTHDGDDHHDTVHLSRSRPFFFETRPPNRSPSEPLLNISGPIVLAAEPDDAESHSYVEQEPNGEPPAKSDEAASVDDPDRCPFPDDRFKCQDENQGKLALMIQGVSKKYRQCASVSRGHVLNGLDLKKCYMHQMYIYIFSIKFVNICINIYGYI